MTGRTLRLLAHAIVGALVCLTGLLADERCVWAYGLGWLAAVGSVLWGEWLARRQGWQDDESQTKQET